MSIKLTVRGYRGQFFDQSGQPLGPDFPAFTSPEVGRRQIELLWDRRLLGLYEYDDLHEELDNRWRTYPWRDRLWQCRDGFLDWFEMSPYLQAVGVAVFLVRLLHDQAPPVNRTKGGR